MIKQIIATDKQSVLLSNTCFQALRDIYRPTPLALQRKQSTSKAWLSFGYFIADELVASVEVKSSANELHFSALAVSKAYRKQGIARKLLYGVIDNYQHKQMQSALVCCVEQTGNVTIFEALGFKVVKKSDSELFELASGERAIEVQLKRIL